MSDYECPKCKTEYDASGSHKDDSGEYECDECGFKFNVEIGFNGVYKERDKWLAMITINGKSRRIGLFEKIEEAVAARKIEDEKNGFHMNHGKIR